MTSLLELFYRWIFVLVFSTLQTRALCNVDQRRQQIVTEFRGKKSMNIKSEGVNMSEEDVSMATFFMHALRGGSNQNRRP